LEISAAILAGGRATRLGGADKASLVVGGSRIVERQLAALAGVTGDLRIVVADTAPAANGAPGANAPRYGDLGVRVVPDAIAGAGPLGGVYTALLDARHERVLILACDLPFVTAAFLERLAAEGRTGEQVDAVVPRTRRGLEPLCAVYAKACAGRARALIARGDLRMTALLADLHVRELGHEALAPYDEETLFDNVNTPHDYARARGRVEFDEKPFEDRITE
jgi:molybdopterin-guanine dinucleotide biosynthesis protein A